MTYLVIEILFGGGWLYQWGAFFQNELGDIQV
jgi:hypothetical protein